jgi:hypothetical protein
MGVAWELEWGILTALVIFIGLYYLIMSAFGAAIGAHDLAVALIRLGGWFLFSFFILTMWNTPVPGYGAPLRAVLPNWGADLQNLFEQARFDRTVDRIANIMTHLQKPDSSWMSFDIPGVIMYIFVEADMIFLGTIMLFPMLVGFAYLGLGIIMLPLVTPLVMLPRFSSKFWGAVDYLFKYSLFPAWIGLLTFFWSGVIDTAIQELAFDANGSISLDQFFGKALLVLVTVTFACGWTVVKSPQAIGEFLTGSTQSGSSFIAAFFKTI